MKKTLLFVFCFLLNYCVSSGQNIPFEPRQSLGISYRSSQNPYYWRNRAPRADYWQQDVHYKIKAELDPDTRTIIGKEILIYYNNSPDTLEFVYFHLYQNAFQPGSYNDQFRRAAGNFSLATLSKSSRGGIDIDTVLDRRGRSLRVELDNTIMKVYLDNPLLPGDSVQFRIDFKTYFGFFRRRMKYNPSYGFDQFTATQWYPRISVYDQHFGWTTDQHLGHEFYGDFGTYEVELTLPNDFIVAATGFLLNRKEVLPDTLMAKLDIRNFKDKPYRERPSVLIKRIPDSTKTWKYLAVNVHDFAWTADPSYRIGVAEWDGIKCYAFAREWKAAKWQDAAQFAADVIRVYSSDFGRYGYHKMIVADADDGMEYPMITMDGGTSPGYYGLLAHEIGHNWFFGMVGNNETYRAFLDEGFTSFLTTWSMEKLVHRKGRPNKENYRYENNAEERWGNYRSYFGNVRLHSDAPLTIHSDRFNLTPGGGFLYSEVYYKTVVMLYALQYVLGDELFQKAMAHYFNEWKFCHPYEEDFRRSIIAYTHWDLNWFFDEWLDQAYSVDYGVESFKAEKQKAGWQARVKIRRKGKAVMPVDLIIRLQDGSSRLAIIPVSQQVKEVPGAIVLPRWYGWGKVNPTYSATIPLSAKPVSVEIDPSGRLADSYQLDNYSGFPRIQILPKWKNTREAFDKYTIRWAPSVWFNEVDGFRPGLNLEGGYMAFAGFGQHGMRLSTGLGANLPRHPFSYTFSWMEPLSGLPHMIFFTIGSRMRNGYGRHGFDLTVQSGSFYSPMATTRTIRLGINFSRLYEPGYLWAKNLWNDRPLNTLRVQYSSRYHYGRRKGDTGNFSAILVTSLPGTPSPFSKFIVETVQKIRAGKLDLRVRGIVGYATRGVPAQAAFYLNMASPEDWVTHHWFAARGTLPPEWGRKGHLHPGGGGNLRGYNLEFFQTVETSVPTSNNRLAAVNLELGLWNPISRLLGRIPLVGDWLRFDLYAFSDFGGVNFVLSDNRFGINDTRFDAGFGIYWQPRIPWRIMRFTGRSFIRFDFPLYLSDPESGEKNLAFRWVLGFGRAF